jgi:hypothetical protein
LAGLARIVRALALGKHCLLQEMVVVVVGYLGRLVLLGVAVLLLAGRPGARK